MKRDKLKIDTLFIRTIKSFTALFLGITLCIVIFFVLYLIKSLMYPDLHLIVEALKIFIFNICVLFLLLISFIPMGVAIGIYITEFINIRKIKIVTIILTTMTSFIPSLVLGFLSIVMYSVFIKYCSLCGANLYCFNSLWTYITLGLIAFPRTIEMTTSVLNTTDVKYYRMGLSLGASKINYIKYILLRIAKKKLLYLSLISVLKIISDSAPLIVLLGISSQVVKLSTLFTNNIFVNFYPFLIFKEMFLVEKFNINTLGINMFLYVLLTYIINKITQTFSEYKVINIYEE